MNFWNGNRNKLIIILLIIVISVTFVFAMDLAGPDLESASQNMVGNSIKSVQTFGNSQDSVKLGTTAAPSNYDNITLLLNLIELKDEKDTIRQSELISTIDRQIKEKYDEDIYKSWLKLTLVIFGNTFPEDHYFNLLYGLTVEMEDTTSRLVNNIVRLFFESNGDQSNGLYYAELIQYIDGLVTGSNNLDLEKSWQTFIKKDRINNDYFDLIHLVLTQP